MPLIWLLIYREIYIFNSQISHTGSLFLQQALDTKPILEYIVIIDVMLYVLSARLDERGLSFFFPFGN